MNNYLSKSLDLKKVKYLFLVILSNVIIIIVELVIIFLIKKIKE